MCRLYSAIGLIMSSVSFFGCVHDSGFSPQSWKFPIDGRVTSISRSELAAAIAEANADRIYAVHVIDRNHVRVDISDDFHEVGNYDKRGRYYTERIHGEPMYVNVTRVSGKWDRGGAYITTY